MSRAALTFISFLRSLSLIATGASDVVSVPPAMPASMMPSAILSATIAAAWRPVPQACWMSVAGVSAASFEPSTDSRTRLKSRECLSTAPATTSPSRSPSRPKRVTSPSSAAVNISWLEASAYAVLERANGMRLPPSTATRRVSRFILLSWPQRPPDPME